jgi:hypothetical protein
MEGISIPHKHRSLANDSSTPYLFKLSHFVVFLFGEVVVVVWPLQGAAPNLSPAALLFLVVGLLGRRRLLVLVHHLVLGQH